MSFASFDLDSRLLRGIEDLGFTEPTAIQRDALPAAIAGRDLLACAETGSGKTAAFVLPILDRLVRAPGRGIRALVITPTRELAAQIDEHLRSLGRYCGISSIAVHGGVSMEPQRRALRQGANIVVATPGRLLDHMDHGNYAFSGLEVLVLDEADRMLDMGFIPDVRRILRRLPTERQTLFFSATIPQEVAALSRTMLQEPVTIDVERAPLPVAGVAQSAYPVRSDLKGALLVELLRSRSDMERVLVFTRTKHRADRVFEYLEHHRIDVALMHGDCTQPHRTRALEGFRSGRFRVLVATDIAARGIDVSELTHVVNHDVPQTSDDYIHRVGRTARAGAIGEALTFVGSEEESDLRSIERAIGKLLPRVSVEPFTDAFRIAPRPLPKAPTGLNANRRALRGGRR
jgi:ATP-dependent RNA helicase RhlE